MPAAGADDNNATLTLKLKADSGYVSDERHRITPEQWEKICRVLNGTEAALSAARQEQPVAWMTPMNTVGAMINNLQTLPLDMPVCTAYFVDIEGKRIAKTTVTSLSREVVANNRIAKFDASLPTTLVIWATQDERETARPPQEKQAEDKS